ncbi:hypothetical protein FRB95_008667 [Tulasnella sp. JGI-2019a]|nr:hypothetical protein FRB95_008667 [Tulasnella sp. JGI-2019a]
MLVLGVLIPLNFALTGYETVSVFQSDFNEIPDLWFWHFGNKPLPGSLCDPRTISVGDTVFTNYSLLTWTIDTIFEGSPVGLSGNTINRGLSTLKYSGESLDKCEITSLDVVGILQPPSSTFKAIVLCVDDDFPVMMSTTSTLGLATMPDGYSLGITVGLEFYLGHATDDMSHSLTPGLVSLAATMSFGNTLDYELLCHNQRLGTVDQSCTTVPVNLHDIVVALGWANGTVHYTVIPSPSSELFATTIPNIMQFLIAAARLDIGNVFPNNVLVYPNVLNATMSTNTSLYNSFLWEPSVPNLGDTSRPAAIASEYLCHIPQRKPLGWAIVSVLVATLSMFGSAWAAFLVVATFYEKRKYPQGNLCNCHPSEYEMVKKNDLQEISEEFLLQGRERGEV